MSQDDPSFTSASSPAEPDPDEAAAGRSGKTIAAWVGLGVLGVLLALYLIGVLMTVGGVPENTEVAGVEIGGKTVSEASATLETELAEVSVAPITVTAREAESVLEPESVELVPDYDATAEIASGPIFNPIRLFNHLTGQTVEVEPVVSYDEALMTEALTRFSQTADEPAVEPVITMDPVTPTVEPGTVGEGIDGPAAADAIEAAYLFTTGPLALPVTVLDPTVSDEEAQRVLEEFAEPAVSGPVEVQFDGEDDSLSAETTSDALTFSAVEGTLQPALNVEVLRSGLPVLAEAEQPGTNATWDVSSGTPVVVPSKAGSGVPDDELTAAVLAVLPLTTPSERVAVVDFGPVDPELNTEQAEALNVTEQLSTFTQPFDYAEYREVNVGQASEYMDGFLLKPGDEYSMNGTIKERTVANGYTSGTYISGGRFTEGLGGGVSIATTAAWTAAFFAGLKDIEVNPHSLYISRYQPGLEATVAWGLLDLRFENNTGNGVLITSEAGPTFITVTMWGTKVYDDIQDESSDRYNFTDYSTRYDDTSECSSQSGSDGFTIDVWRVFYEGNREVDREKFTTIYDPTTRYVCSPPPQPSPPPAPEADPSPSETATE